MKSLSRTIIALIIFNPAIADTAMAQLVGLPLGIFVRLVMEGKITSTGVNIPVMPEVFEPVLEELKSFGVNFEDREEDLSENPPSAFVGIQLFVLPGTRRSR